MECDAFDYYKGVILEASYPGIVDNPSIESKPLNMVKGIRILM